MALAGGRLRCKRLPAKTAAAIVSIGAGASVGPEDPFVQIGANLGSMFGQWLHLSDDRVRALVAAGAACGVSAAFSAPIAGVFFALEIVLGEIQRRRPGCGCNCLGQYRQSSPRPWRGPSRLPGAGSAFKLPHREIAFVLALGLLAGPVAVAYTRLLYLPSQDAFHHLPRVTAWAKPMIAGSDCGYRRSICAAGARRGL